MKSSGLKRTGSKVVFGLISVVILLWTGYLTTSFLSMVLPASFWVVPYLGLVVFDGGMIGWMFVYLYLAEGSMQRTIALGLTVFNLIGVGLMTIAEIVLGGQTFTAAPEMLGTVAIWGVGIWTFVNVAAIVGFHLSSPDARIAAAIQEEKDAVVDEALTDLSNRRSDNAKLLSSQLGAGMYKTLVSELGADRDGDGLPDVAERPSNRRTPATPATPDIDAATLTALIAAIQRGEINVPVMSNSAHSGPTQSNAIPTQSGQGEGNGAPGKALGGASGQGFR